MVCDKGTGIDEKIQFSKAIDGPNFDTVQEGDSCATPEGKDEKYRKDHHHHREIATLPCTACTDCRATARVTLIRYWAFVAAQARFCIPIASSSESHWVVVAAAILHQIFLWIAAHAVMRNVMLYCRPARKEKRVVAWTDDLD